jgi:hypothetical protein
MLFTLEELSFIDDLFKEVHNSIVVEALCYKPEGRPQV